MFVWAKIPPKYVSSSDFAMDLIEKAGVLVTPGSAFGPLGEGHVRIAWCRTRTRCRRRSTISKLPEYLTEVI
jgi:LL-diaminopimelate aminotransferase